MKLLVKPVLYRAYAALALVCVLWGLTFAGITVALEIMPPFFLAWVRMLIPGLLLLGYCWYKGEGIPAVSVLRQTAFAGLLMLFSNNVLITWSLQYIPTGIAGLLFTLLPGFTLLIEVFITRTLKLKSAGVAGVLLGFVGLFLVYLQQNQEWQNPYFILGAGLTLAAVLLWAIGSVYTKQIPAGVSAYFSSGLQLTVAALACLPLSLITEDWSQVHFSAKAAWSVTFLVLTDSLLAFTAFLYALKHLPGTVVSVYAYVNTLVIVGVGYFFLNEKAGLLTFAGTVLTLAGVYLINKAYGLHAES